MKKILFRVKSLEIMKLLRLLRQHIFLYCKIFYIEINFLKKNKKNLCRESNNGPSMLYPSTIFTELSESGQFTWNNLK